MGMLSDLKGKVIHETFISGYKHDLTIGRVLYLSDEAIMLEEKGYRTALILTYEKIERLSQGKTVSLHGISKIRLLNKELKLERI